MALELVFGAKFNRVLHLSSSLTRWSGSRGQVCQEKGRKRQKLKLYLLFLGSIATQLNMPLFTEGASGGRYLGCHLRSFVRDLRRRRLYAHIPLFGRHLLVAALWLG